MIGKPMRFFGSLTVLFFLSVVYPGADSSLIEPASSGAGVNGVTARRDAVERVNPDLTPHFTPAQADDESGERFNLLDERAIVDFSTVAPADNPSVQWTQADTLAIEIDANANAWHAGRVTDVLALDSDGLVVGTESGGVWAINRAGGAMPLSNDWDVPNINCLAFGPDNPRDSLRHIYAGCNRNNTLENGALYETNTSDRLPIMSWRRIPIPDNAGEVFRIGVLAATRRIVLACSNGVWWSPIPPAPSATGNYTWRRAQGLPDGAYSGAAAGPNDTIAVSAYGSNLNTGLYGIFYGDWSTGELVMRRATINGFDEKQMCWTSLASCDSNRSSMYALTTDSEGHVTTVLRLSSTDRGWSFSMAGTTVEGVPAHEPAWTINNPVLLGDKEAGGFLHTISVSPSDPNTVAFCWKYALISTNGGQSWRALGRRWTDADHWEYDNSHLHDDVHAVAFDPTNSSRLYIASDGGVAMSTDVGKTFSSSHNRKLLNLQFYSTSVPLNFWGTLAVSSRIAGLVAGGTQDNGNVYSQLEQPGPWKQLKGCGDGGRMAFLNTGNLLASCTNGYPASSTTWTGTQFTSLTDVPVRPTGPSRLSKLDGTVVESVNAPTFRNMSNQLMYAAGGRGAEVYGLFSNDDGGDMHWEFLGLVSVNAGKYIHAVGSSNGLTIFVGTNDGKTFAFDTGSRSARELSIPIEAAKPGPIGRIVVKTTAQAYATLNLTSIGFVLRLDGFHWNAIAFTDGVFHALEMDRTTSTLFAATDRRVYMSRDNGATWQSASQGLTARPHCADLRFVVHSDGARYLYLSTYGRSLWRARL